MKRVTVLSQAHLRPIQAREARMWKGDEIPAQKARKALVALVELSDPQGVRINVEFNAGFDVQPSDIKIGDVMVLDGDFSAYEGYTRIYNVDEHVSVSSKK